MRPPHGHTDTTENITFPYSVAGGKYSRGMTKFGKIPDSENQKRYQNGDVPAGENRTSGRRHLSTHSLQQKPNSGPITLTEIWSQNNK